MNQITVTSPLLPDLDQFNDMLRDIWSKKWITNNGEYHRRLEQELAHYLKVPYVSLFTNGTLPLITALQALRVTGEVITTPYSFVATTHALWWNGIRPVFVDIDPATGNIDPDRIEAAITPKTTAIMPAHCYGKPCDVVRIQEIADRYGLKVIYDAAHAFGVEQAPQPPKGGVRGSANPIYYAELKRRAAEHRNNPTEAERLIWHLLSGNRLDGFKFRRQHIIDSFIVDFVCLEKRLVVEIDGEYHDSQKQTEDDATRTSILNSLGYRVIRFKNQQVLCCPEHVLAEISSALQLPLQGVRGASILNWGDLSTLSFHATKVFNTIEGGAMVMHDEQTKRRIDYLKNFGFASEVEVVGPGINSKMDEIRAAYGLLNLRQVDAAIEARHQVAIKYREALRDVPGITFWDDIPGVRHNYSYFPIFVDEEAYGMSRDALYFKMRDAGILGRRYFYPLISEFSTYRGLPSARPENLPRAHRMANTVICLPMHHALTAADTDRVINSIVK